jgi:hypothetical protein
MKMPSLRLAGLLLAATLLSACATAPVVVQQQDAWLAHLHQVIRNESDPGSVLLRPAADEVRIGSGVALDVTPRRSGYLYLYHLGTGGDRPSLLFPNASDGANFVNAPTRLPRAHWRLSARGPQGVGHFLAVLTEQPQDAAAQAEALRRGTIAIRGRYAASLVQVRELP